MRHSRLRLALYISDGLDVFSLMVLIVFFSLTGWLLPVPDRPQAPEDGTAAATTSEVRAALLALFLAAMAINGILLMLARFRGLYKYPVPVTAANVEAQYYLGKIMLGTMGTGVNAFTCLSMLLLYQLRIRLDGPRFLAMTGMLLAFCLADWLIYYAVARRFGDTKRSCK